MTYSIHILSVTPDGTLAETVEGAVEGIGEIVSAIVEAYLTGLPIRLITVSSLPIVPSAPAPGVATETPAETPRKKRHQSPEARKAVSARMKKWWASPAGQQRYRQMKREARARKIAKAGGTR